MFKDIFTENDVYNDISHDITNFYFSDWIKEQKEKYNIDFTDNEENVKTYYPTSNFAYYKNINNNLILYFLNNNKIICPFHFLYDCPISITQLYHKTQNNNNDKITLFLISDYEPIELEDLDKINKNITCNKEIKKIIYKGKFKSLEIYYKFIDTIYEIFHIYPNLHYACEIKQDKTYIDITSYILLNNIPTEKLLYNNNIYIDYCYID